MFTGLIQEVGKVAGVTKRRGDARLRVSAPRIARSLKLGDSISVNGVCLTAVNIKKDSFDADLAKETVARTTLAEMRPRAVVNLELPTPAGTPLGGHIVQGHIDGVATVTAFDRIGNDWRMTVELPAEIARYVVEKGSIAIDGISLTAARVSGRTVEIAIIPHTYEATNLKSLKPGGLVNVEADALAKYAERRKESSTLTVESLIAEGF